MAGSLALAFSAPAGADTGYPGTTTVTTPVGPHQPGGDFQRPLRSDGHRPVGHHRGGRPHRMPA